MRSVLALLLLSWSLPVAASEMLVFKKDGPYRGAAMKVASYERKAGRLLIRTEAGDVFSAPEDSVDWEQSRRSTAKLQEDEVVQAEKLQAEQRSRRAAAAAAARPRELSVVEASRRFGVDHPAMSVASGSARKDTAGSAVAPATEAKPEAGTGQGGSNLPPLVRQAGERLDRAKAEKAQVQKSIDELAKDNNPDPVWAANRATQLAEKQRRLADLDRQITTLEREVETARQEAAK